MLAACHPALSVVLGKEVSPQLLIYQFCCVNNSWVIARGKETGEYLYSVMLESVVTAACLFLF